MLTKFLTAFSLLVVVVAAFDESTIMEKKAEEMDNTVDAKWMESVKKWYVPMWSKLDRARTASELFRKPVTDMTLEEVSTPACMIFSIASLSSGFNRKGKFEMEPIMDTQKSNSMIGLNMKGITIDGKFQPMIVGGKTSFKLTDNASFILMVGLWDDGEASWAVVSTKPEIDAETTTQVLSMVKGLGFMEKNFVMESFSGCKDAEGKKV